MRRNVFYTTRVAAHACSPHHGAVLTLLLLVALLVPHVLRAADNMTWVSAAAERYTADNPWQINSAADLKQFCDYVNGTSKYLADKNKMHNTACAILTADIDLSSVCHAATSDASEVSWTPISFRNKKNEIIQPFWEGTFDGNGHTISNLYINTPDDVNGVFSGLFGQISKGAVIKNLTIKNAYVCNNYKSHDGVGILVGCATTVHGRGSNVTIQNVMIDETSTVKCTACSTVGGFIGNILTVGCVFQDCACSATVQNKYSYAGGLVGDWQNPAAGVLKNVFCNANVTASSNGGTLFGYIGDGVSVTGLVAYDSDATLTLNGSTVAATPVGEGTLTSPFLLGYSHAMLKTGLVTYLLQRDAADGVVWGQDLSDSQKAYPVLGSTSKVYVDKDVTYSCLGEFKGGSFTNTKPATEGVFRLTHPSATHHSGYAAQCFKSGIKEYYQCNNCSKMYLDADMLEETDNIVIDPLGHDYYGQSDKCSRCGTSIATVKLGDNSVSDIEMVVGGEEDANGYNLFKFDARYDGTLELSMNDAGLRGTLWDGSKATCLARAANSEDADAGFSISCDVTSGKTYYVGVRNSDGSAVSGDFTLTLKYSTPDDLNGSGTAAEPFELKTAEHMRWFAGYVNGTNTTQSHKDACAKLMNDISMSSVCHAAGDDGEAERSWTPVTSVKYSSDAYSGTFDGNGKTISDLYISLDQYYVGLFGYVNKGTIKNLSIENAKVSNGANGRYTGIVVGMGGNATIEGVRVDGQSVVTAQDDYVGGIAGAFDGNIQNCENRATVSSTSNYAGGICGYLQYSGSVVKQCINYGKVTSSGSKVGGIAGRQGSGTIEDCANYAAVEGNDHVGGIAGETDKAMKNVFANGDVAATGSTANAGLVAGFVNGASASGVLAYDSEAALSVGGSQVEAKSVGFGEFTSGNDCVAAFTKEQILTGEVTYKLNGGVTDGTQVWYQKLGDEGDTCPIQTSASGNTVYLAKGVRCDGAALEGYPEKYLNEATYIAAHDFQAEKLSSGVYISRCSLCRISEGNRRIIKDFAGDGKDIDVKTDDSDYSYNVDQLTLTDAKPYNNPVQLTVGSLTYDRSFAGKAGKWQALYVPFAFDCADLSDGYEVAEVNMFHEYQQKDGSIKTVLEVLKLTSGTLSPYYPYVIRLKEGADESQPVFKENKSYVLQPTSSGDKNYFSCASMKRTYKFWGILSPKSDFVVGQDFVLGGGKLSKASVKTTLSAQRWYLNATDRDDYPGGGTTSAEAKLQSISIEVVGEGEATGIRDITVTTDTEDSADLRHGIYDLQGRKLNHEPASGVYIKDGKKYVK